MSRCLDRTDTKWLVENGFLARGLTKKERNLNPPTTTGV